MRDGRRQTVPVKLAERPLRERTPDGLGEALGAAASAARPSRTETPLGLTRARAGSRRSSAGSRFPRRFTACIVSRVDPTGAGVPGAAPARLQ